MAVISAGVDPSVRGEVARSFRFRALSGETVSVDTSVELKLVSWSAAMMFVLDGIQHDFKVGQHGFGRGAVPIPGVGFSGELAVAGGRLHLAKIPSSLEELTPEGREFVERALGDQPLTANAAGGWVGYWTDAEQRFDLVLAGTNWDQAEREALHQLSAFKISVDDLGIAVRPAVPVRRLGTYGSHIVALLPPLGMVKLLPKREAQGLLSAKQSSLPLKHGGLRRLTIGERGTDTEEEVIVFANRSSIGVIRDPRFKDLDQADRLSAIQDLNLKWF